MHQIANAGYLVAETEDDIAALQTAAESRDESIFVQVAHEIDWSQRPAGDFVRAVHLALAVGAHLLARKLAAQGAERHPGHEELQKMARVLAPPRFVEALAPSSSAQANQAWMRDHTDEYRGRWVAVRAGELLAVGETAREVWDRLEDTNNVLVTKAF